MMDIKFKIADIVMKLSSDKTLPELAIIEINDLIDSYTKEIITDLFTEEHLKKAYINGSLDFETHRAKFFDVDDYRKIN